MTEDAVENVHTWFGRQDAPLFGTLHLPAGRRSRAVAVILPPVGIEMLVAHRTLRVLAERLARQGVAALRVDYQGTGDSADVPPDDDQVPSWLGTVRESVEYARRAGARRVAVVGMRLGATIAAAAAAQVDALVLWDPVETGARFLREETLLYRAGVPDAGDDPADGILGPGMWYSSPTVAGLRALSLEAVLAGDGGAPRVRGGIGPVLLATRAEAAGGRLLAGVSAAAGVEAIALPGHDALFDWAAMTVPERAVDEIVSWLGDRFDPEGSPLDPEVRRGVVVAVAPDGSPVRERVVELAEGRQFGILTEVDGRTGETLVLVNAAPPAIHVGPARMWVDIAREHAWRTGPVLRFDGRAEGESREGGGVTYPSSYTREAVDDVVAALRAARALSPDDSTLVVGGLCAAAWTSLRAAAVERVDAVVAINPGFWQVRSMTTSEGAWPLPATGPKAASNGATRRRRAARHTLRTMARAALPEPLWWRLSRRGVLRGPSGMVTPLVRAGTSVHLMLGRFEGALFDRMRGDRLERSLRASGRLRVTRAPQVDHALLSPEARQAVVAAFVRPDFARETPEGLDAARERVRRPATPANERIH